MANSNLDPKLKARLGADLKFPIAGSFEPIDGVSLIVQDIERLLLTLPGERVNRPEFGCALRSQIWENIDVAAENGSSAIRNALDSFEPRITVTGVSYSVNENTGLIVFNIKFIINLTDSPFNLVFPFRTGTALSFG